ncbi:hypothetical protein ANO11243_093470 [Dothideomycetidae sp. 11243]|nr:hypothetical protein ANO11243_093470 [fungal sp. No.11243]
MVDTSSSTNWALASITRHLCALICPRHARNVALKIAIADRPQRGDFAQELDILRALRAADTPQPLVERLTTTRPSDRISAGEALWMLDEILPRRAQLSQFSKPAASCSRCITSEHTAHWGPRGQGLVPDWPSSASLVAKLSDPGTSGDHALRLCKQAIMSHLRSRRPPNTSDPTRILHHCSSSSGTPCPGLSCASHGRDIRFPQVPTHNFLHPLPQLSTTHTTTTSPLYQPTITMRAFAFLPFVAALAAAQSASTTASHDVISTQPGGPVVTSASASGSQLSSLSSSASSVSSSLSSVQSSISKSASSAASSAQSAASSAISSQSSAASKTSASAASSASSASSSASASASKAAAPGMVVPAVGGVLGGVIAIAQLL